MGFAVILNCSNLPMAGTMEKDSKEWGNKMQRASLKALREIFPEVSADQGFLHGDIEKKDCYRESFNRNTLQSYSSQEEG